MSVGRTHFFSSNNTDGLKILGPVYVPNKADIQCPIQGWEGEVDIYLLICAPAEVLPPN